MLEFFHAAPDVTKVLSCMKKQIEYRRMRERSRPPPRLWIIAAGRPHQALSGLGFQPDHTWPTGVYWCPLEFFTTLIVVSELPKTRATLLLRIMGAGRVFHDAISELMALPTDAPERRLALPIMLRLRLTVREAAERTPEDQDFEMSTQALVDEWEKDLLQQGEQLGIQKGEQLGIQKGEQLGIQKGERRGAVGMRVLLLELLRTRFGGVDDSTRQRISDASIDDLERWSTRVSGAQELAEIFNEPLQSGLVTAPLAPGT